MNNLGKSAIHIAQAFANQLPDEREQESDASVATQLERRVFSITRNPLFTHYVPVQAPLDNVPVAQPSAAAEEEDQSLSADERVARDVKLRSGLRIEALFRTSCVKRKSIHLSL